MRFYISTLLWVAAFIAFGVALFGVWGSLAALLLIPTAWVFRRFASVYHRTIGQGLATLGVLAFGFWVQWGLNEGRKEQCVNRLRNVAIELEFFREVYGRLPRPLKQVSAKNAEANWRVMESEFNCSNFNRNYHHAEPWNSPYNAKVMHDSRSYTNLCCPVSCDDDRPLTNYFAVLGLRTAWPGDHGVKISEITDDPRTTVLVVEHPRKRAAWNEPVDVPFDDAVKLFSTRPALEDVLHKTNDGLFYKSTPILNVLCADSRVHAVRLPLSRANAEALFTIAGGEKINWRNLDADAKPELDYAKITATGLFAMVALAPVIYRRKANIDRETMCDRNPPAAARVGV